MSKETLLAFFFGLGGLFAGYMIASQLEIFQLSSWSLALYPAIISAKGVTGGLLSARLSTGLHLGTVNSSFFKNTKYFYKLFEALIIITLATSITICIFALFFGNLFWGMTLVDFPSILLVLTATMTIGLLLSLVTMKVAFLSFKKGLDPDVVVYPVMSTVSDIFITLCYIVVLNLFFAGELGTWAVILIAIIPMVLAVYILPKNFHQVEFIKTLKESMVTMVFVAFMVNVTGTILNGISRFVEGRKEIYTVYPALIGMIGNVGSVIGSTATTKLALGFLSPSFYSIRHHAKTILSAWIASVLMFGVLAVTSLSIHDLFSLTSFLPFLSVLLVANFIAVAAIILLSYAVSILTFKRGLDPDNFVIPVVSSFADSITTVALLAALFLIG
jgi:mgtE-like transporter